MISRLRIKPTRLFYQCLKFTSFITGSATLIYIIHSSFTSKLENVKPRSAHGLYDKYKQWKRDILDSYENRLRAFSHPLKVFQHFASVHKGDQSFMTANDFLRSLTPHQHLLVERTELKQFENTASAAEFLKLADVDGDDLISFSEYMLFLICLSIPKRMWTTAFRLVDRDDSGSLCFTEFSNLFDRLGRELSVYSRLGFLDSNAGISRCGRILDLFFGPSKSDELTLARFEEFLQGLHLQVLKLEFCQYEVLSERNFERSSISLSDFARTMVSFAHGSDMSEFFQRIQNLPNYSERVSFAQFKEFDDRMRDKLVDFDEAFKLLSYFNSCLDKAELTRVLSITTGFKLSDQMADMLVRVFDVNRTNRLDSSVFISTIKHRISRNISPASSRTFLGNYNQ